MESDYNTRNKNDSWIFRKKEQAATDVKTIKSTHVRLKSFKIIVFFDLGVLQIQIQITIKVHSTCVYIHTNILK